MLVVPLLLLPFLTRALANRPLPIRFEMDANPLLSASMGLDYARVESKLGHRCDFTTEAPFNVCGEVFNELSSVTSALFCSPLGYCGGSGAACGTSESCGKGSCLDSTYLARDMC